MYFVATLTDGSVIYTDAEQELAGWEICCAEFGDGYENYSNREWLLADYIKTMRSEPIIASIEYVSEPPEGAVEDWIQVNGARGHRPRGPGHITFS